MRAQAGDGLHAGGVQHQHLLIVRDGALRVVQHVVDARQAQLQPRLARELLTTLHETENTYHRKQNKKTPAYVYVTTSYHPVR